MRISDWSSDVCSSDLFAVRRMPEDIRPEGLPAAPDPSDCGAECDRKDHCATRQTKKDGTVSGALFDNWRSGRDSNPRPPEIGRAARRERVCPYVYIYVVAVSYKQKLTQPLNLTTIQ